MIDTRDILRILSFGDGDIDEDTGIRVTIRDDGYATLRIRTTDAFGNDEHFTARINKEEK